MHRCVRITATRSNYKTTALSCELLRYLSTPPHQIRIGGGAAEPGPRVSSSSAAAATGHVTRTSDQPEPEGHDGTYECQCLYQLKIIFKGARTYNNWELITHFINLNGADMPSVLYN